MTRIIGLGLIAVVFALAVAWVLSFFGVYVLNQKPPTIDLPENTTGQQWEPDMENLIQWTEAEAVNIVVSYNLDVQVDNSHAWNRHNVQATNAIRCLTQNGTFMVLSEKESRNLHLLCIDQKTNQAYVVIITKILRFANDAKNATSKLITAFELTNVTVDQYIKYETQIKAIIVRLSFLPGELFFAP